MWKRTSTTQQWIVLKETNHFVGGHFATESDPTKLAGHSTWGQAKDRKQTSSQGLPQRSTFVT